MSLEINNKPKETKNTNKSLLLKDLEISIVLYQFLKNHLKIKSLKELEDKTENDIRDIKGFSNRNMKELSAILSENNISLKK